MVEESDNKLLENYSTISILTALKPRQVMLAEQRKLQKHKPGETMTKQQLNQKTDILKDDDHKLVLLHSVVKYINDKGFVKTFKRFLKEAQLEDDTWKANSFDLEEMYCKHLENCRNGDTNNKGHMEQEESANGTMVKDPGGDKGAPVETVSKKKKKKKEENDENAKSTFSEVKMDDSVNELRDKKKKKKKNKLTSESHDENGMREDSLPAVAERKQGTEIVGGDGRNNSAKTTKSKDKVKEGKPRMVFPVEDGKEARKVVVSSTDAANILLDHNKTESKEKKKKKKVSDSEKLSNIGVEVFDKEKSQETKENGADKKSKKRKRTASDESKDKPVEGVAVEESKRRKAEGTEEADVNTPQAEVKPLNGADLHVGGESNQENGSVSQMKPQKSSTKQFDGSEKGDLMNNGVERSSDKRSAKKQRFDSAEPKTVNAFQRVKVDDVEFADDKLQDNSYWAKGGADSGYGAKAQEVLGQVKGRDFRHEKTKKKRGSYRGGQIDLQSHSVKFNYSDAE